MGLLLSWFQENRNFNASGVASWAEEARRRIDRDDVVKAADIPSLLPPGATRGAVDNPRPMSQAPFPEPDDALRVEDYFRDGAVPADALLWWQLERQEALLAAQRALFGGPAPLVRLRVWVFFELMALRESRLTREALNQAFHVLRDEVLDSVLKRLRLSLIHI